MFEAMLTALQLMLNGQLLFYLVLGALLGCIIGAIPGLGGMFALSILLPFAYPMDIYSGIAFLLAAHAVINTSGSVTAILFATPGSAGTAATVLDGYPLTQQGQAGRALGANLTASALGGIFGAIVLTLMVPVIKPVVLMFQTPEFFMLTLIGITMIAVLSSGSILKSLIVGFAGILLSMIGLDATNGIPRYTFGSLYLWDGLAIVPVVIGLFAIAEMLDLTARGAKRISDKKQKVNNMFGGMIESFKYWKLILQGGVIGSGLGSIPGIGGDTINFVAYGAAKSISKEPEKFGKGSIEGVIGPESANNAKEGGILIPTLAFGIPGSVAMAILLGAFVIWGVQPGPLMLTEDLPIVYVMIFTLVIGNVVGGVFTWVISSYAMKLTNLRSSLLIPGIITLSFVAAFATTSKMGDVLVAVTFGIIGFFMKKYDYSRAVLLIGLVLGIKAEGYLNLSMRLYSYEFLFRPSVIAMFLLIILILIWPMVMKRIRNKTQGGE